MQLKVPHGMAPGARVLLIEDEYLIAMMVQDMLADLDCVCIGPIVNKKQGLHAAKNEICDAAIINLIIQGENAYDIAATLAARGIPFCFASGMPQSEIIEEWRGRPFLAKPYTIDRVREFLLGVLVGK
jgi:response regulator RpfG family c-di-GMP phosphodiesterase